MWKLLLYSYFLIRKWEAHITFFAFIKSLHTIVFYFYQLFIQNYVNKSCITLQSYSVLYKYLTLEKIKGRTWVDNCWGRTQVEKYLG